MKTLFIFSILSLLMNCNSAKIENENYNLKIAQSQKAVLILFPCFPCDKEHTAIEAKFLKEIEKDGITTILLDYNQKLYLNENETIELAEHLNQIFQTNKIKNENVFIGGFSSGGNVALLITNHLLKTKNSLQPKGVFVVDSPIDLEELYNGAKKDIDKNFDAEAVEEAKFLIELFESEIGNPSERFENYIKNSPYLVSNNSLANIEYLKNIKTRFYSEPDLEWQTQNKSRK